VLNALCTQAEGSAAAAQLARETGAEVTFDGADLRDVTEIERMMTVAEVRFGGIDILVNNAVVRHFKPIDEFTVQEWDASVAVNLSAAFHAARLTIPFMRARGWGRIVNLASIYGFRGAENRVDYVTTKTALIGMARAIAIETARTGITCNAVCPGTVASPAILERIRLQAEREGIAVDQAERDYIEKRHPTGRFVALDSVGQLIVFLCSSAGDDITGTTLPVDAGWHVS
jgi:3-hydroxybutyrate dehydrogenase